MSKQIRRRCFGTVRAFRSVAAMCSAILFVSASNMVAAQESDETQEPDEGLEQIVVTAQRRAENLQAVPLSVTALTGDDLNDRQITGMNDLESIVPGLIYDDFSAGQPRYYIRGVGNNLESGALTNNVGVFVDGVYLSRPEMTNNDFLDIARVEVLRGPQGTLSGRNVVGGSIRFYTTRPSDEVVGAGFVTVGSYNQTDAGGYISGPLSSLSDNLFGKIAATTRNHDGYMFNTTTQNDVEDEQFTGLRTAVRYHDPGDNIDVMLSLDTSRRRGTGAWSVPMRPAPGFQGPLHLDDPLVGEHSDFDGWANVDNWGTSLNVDWDSGIGTLTSITAYRYSKMDLAFQVLGLKVAQLDDPPEVKARLAQAFFIQAYLAETDQFSQEFRIASPTDGVLDWIAGLYFLKVDNAYNNTERYRFVFPGAETEGHQSFIATNDMNSVAIFGNVNYDFNETLSLQAGLRWTRDERGTSFATGGKPAFASWAVNGVPVDGFTADRKADWAEVTPQLSMKYQPSPSLHFYGTLSQGFKGGGYSRGNLEKKAAVLEVEPEYVLNREIGAKTEWLDGSMRLNVAAFYMTYEDMQVRTIVPFNEFTNLEIVKAAGGATIKGVEMELDWLATPNLRVQGNYTHLATEIRDTVISGVDRSGNELPKAPSNKFTVAGSYSVELSEAIGLRLRADYNYTSEYHTFLQNNPIEIVPSRETINAGIAIHAADDIWSLELWGKNLTDVIQASGYTDIIGTAYAIPFDPPRTYGLTLRVNSN